MTLSIILGVLSVLVILESLFLIIFPMTTKKALKKISKNDKSIRRFGIIEFILGAILLLISIITRSS